MYTKYIGKNQVVSLRKLSEKLNDSWIQFNQPKSNCFNF